MSNEGFPDIADRWSFFIAQTQAEIESLESRLRNPESSSERDLLLQLLAQKRSSLKRSVRRHEIAMQQRQTEE